MEECMACGKEFEGIGEVCRECTSEFQETTVTLDVEEGVG